MRFFLYLMFFLFGINMEVSQADSLSPKEIAYKAEKEANWEPKRLSEEYAKMGPPPGNYHGSISEYLAKQQRDKDLLLSKMEAAKQKAKEAEAIAAPYHRQDNEEHMKSEHLESQAKAKQTAEYQRQLVLDAKTKADEILQKQATEVIDPNSGKDGGPLTIQVLKLASGTSTSTAGQSEQTLMQNIMQNLTGIKIKEIKRGQPLSSLISAQIPSGTKIFPIRLVIESPDGNSTNQDVYYYKDEFGDWASILKH